MDKCNNKSVTDLPGYRSAGYTTYQPVRYNSTYWQDRLAKERDERYTRAQYQPTYTAKVKPVYTDSVSKFSTRYTKYLDSDLTRAS